MHAEGRNKGAATEKNVSEYATGYMNQLSALMRRGFRVSLCQFLSLGLKLTSNLALCAQSDLHHEQDCVERCLWSIYRVYIL